MRTVPPKTILLFYDGYELKARPGLLGALYSNARRAARFAYRTLRRRQTRTGFYTAFLGLKRSLEANGWTVRVNDFAAANANPDQPIGLAGYPSVLDYAPRANPMIFGPGDYGSTVAAAALSREARTRLLTQPCDWAVEYNRPWVGEKGAVYFAGIDTEAWPDLSDRAKTTDFLVYDKIRWFREERVSTVLERCLRDLEAAGRSYRVVRYGHHHIGEFRRALADCRALLFLCEHETQGIAYQEAMSSGLPVLAWDEGQLADPGLAAKAPPGLQVSSVPYFDGRCGLKFKLVEFPAVLARFWSQRADFRPRDYVTDQLSLVKSGRLYLDLMERAR
jgi:hypothetical protein